MRANPIRFTGMASGMDTDSIVKDLMRPQQMKVDKEKKAQALIQLRQDAWRDMNKKLYDFHLNMTNKLSMQSTFNKKITTSSNEAAMSLDNADAMAQGTHTFTILNLAQSASLTGVINNKSERLSKTTQISSVSEGLTVPTDMKIKTVIDGEEKIVTIDVVATDTLDTLTQKMNTALKDTNFVAKYDEANGSFFISSNKTGAGQEIKFEVGEKVGSEPLLETLGLETGIAKEVKADDARYTYNGANFTSATNKIEINGIKATLKAKTTEEVTISAQPDVDATYAFIKEFVGEYNKLMEEINEKLGTKPQKGIDPLTSEERESMSDSDIKLWEDKINKSLFYKDPQLESFLNSARNIMGGIHTSAYNPNPAVKAYEGLPLKYTNLAALGIVTGEWQERGKLYISDDEQDTNRLKEAIANNPEDVMNFFNTLGKKLYDSQLEALKSSDLKSTRIFYNDKAMEKQIKSHDKQILTLEERLYKMEEMHYAKFAAMEKMLSALNNQSSWLSQQVGGF